jgi:hypothetical protein
MEGSLTGQRSSKVPDLQVGGINDWLPLIQDYLDSKGSRYTRWMDTTHPRFGMLRRVRTFDYAKQHVTFHAWNGEDITPFVDPHDEDYEPEGEKNNEQFHRTIGVKTSKCK